MRCFDIRLCLCLVLLLVTGIRGQEDEKQHGEDPSNRAAHTTRGYAGTTSTDRLGVIMSPGYPGNYPNSYRFRYDINLGTEKSDLEINFKIFDLESCSNCDCDYIQIENYKLAKPLKYCGAGLPNGDGQVFLDNLDDYVWITFQSNSDQRRPGFYATYEIIQKAGNDTFLAGGSVCPPVVCPYCAVGQAPEYDYTGVCPYCYCSTFQEKSTPNYPTTSMCPPVVCPTCPYGFQRYYQYTGSRCTHCYCVHSQQSTTNNYNQWSHSSTTHHPFRTTSNRPWWQSTSYRPWWQSTSYRPWQSTSYRPWQSTSYRPWQSTSYRPWQSNSYRTTTYRPWRTDTTSYRPWHPASSTGYNPWQHSSSNYNPWRTSTSGYDQGCGKGYFFSSTGTIMSPGAPDHYYPSGTDCRYNIDMGGVLGTRKTVAIRFTNFDLENCHNCQCDSVTISSEETDHLRMCDGHFVNTSRTYYVHSSSDILKVHFTTDSSVVRSGFSMTYEVMSSEVNDTCDSDSCFNCDGRRDRDYFGCCVCLHDSYVSSTSVYNMASTTSSAYSKSMLLQMLTNIAHHAQMLEQYATALEHEANSAKNLVAQSFG